MPDSKEILFSAEGNLWRLHVIGQQTVEPARLPFVGEDGLMPAVSRSRPSGSTRLVYVRRFTDTNIWRVQTSAPGALSSSPPLVLISSTRMDVVPQFSPDQTQIAFVSNRSGRPEIWLAEHDGANPVQLTFINAAITAAPQWSPDGQRIAVHSNLEGQFDIFVIPASGGKPRNMTSHPSNDHVPSFSRDGQWIYFASNRTGADNYQVWKIPASGGNADQLTIAGGFRPIESVDGHVYYTQSAGLIAPLWCMPTSGGEPEKVLDGVISSAFAVVDKGIYYVDRYAAETRLQFFRLRDRKIFDRRSQPRRDSPTDHCHA
jgi:dipeptidyl aminopeptidase/acylaminoacyl peptidase